MMAQQQEQQQKLPNNLYQSSLLSHFHPPQKCLQFFQSRAKYSKHCKNGHNILICIECEQLFCHDCKLSQKHANKQHANHCVYFSCINGSLLYITAQKKIRVPSLYENNIGNYWTPDKDMVGFTINIELYEQMVLKYYQGELYGYLMKRYGNKLDIVARNGGGIYDGVYAFMDEEE